MTRVNLNARVSEIDALSDILLRRYENEHGLVNDAFLKTQFEKLQKLSDEITEAIKRTKTQSNMEEKDAARDEAVRNLGDMLIGYAASPVAEKKAAAIAVKAIFDKYGKQIATESYANESSFITSLLMDLGTKEAKADIAKLPDVDILIEAIRTTQEAFVVAYDEWATTQNEEATATSASSMKKPIVALINEKIVPYLSVMSDDPVYQKFASFVEQEIGKTNAAVSSRGKKEE